MNNLDVEVYDFDPNVPCDLYNALEYIVNEDIYTPSELENMSNIKARYWIKIIDAVKDGKIKSVNNLCNYIVNGKRIIGKTNIERLYVFLTKYKEDKVKSEINDTSNLIFEVTGKYPTLFRPSYGSCNKMIRSVVDTPIIIWDIDTLDWKYHNSRRISSRVINKVKDGDIVLMHDIYSATANALEIIILSLKSKGYTFVTVSDLFYYKNIPLEKGKVYGFAR